MLELILRFPEKLDGRWLLQVVMIWKYVDLFHIAAGNDSKPAVQEGGE